MNRTIKTISVLAVALALAVPAASQGVVINECFTGSPDYCEIFNPSASPVDISGWTVTMNTDPSASVSVTIPAATTLPPGGFLVVSESPTSPTLPPGVPRVVSTNISWVQGGGGAVALNDAGDVGVDFIIFGNGTNLPTGSPLAPWSGSINNTTDFIERNSNVDTDTAADWSSNPSGTPGDLNPGQSSLTPPTASFTANPTSTVVGATVAFTSTSTGGPTSWAWDLDGDTFTDATGPNPTFAYAAPGSYTVSLTAVNANGSDTLTMPNFITVSVATSATIPYVQDFTNPLGSEWSLATSDPVGRIIQAPITDGGSPSPLSGGNALIMDSSLDGTFSTNTATLRVDLAAMGGGVLRYYFRETNDEDDPEDGVFISDGVTTAQIVSHNGFGGTFVETFVDLTLEAANAGIALTSSFEIIFSQRDNFGVPTDGGFFDDIRVDPPLVPDTGQPNGPLASLNINNGINLNFQAANNGINGPFFATGDTMNMTVGGQPSQPYLLMTGPLNRNNVVFPANGSVDIGSDPTFSDVVILMNGLDPGFFNALAFTDNTGVSDVTIGLTGLPLGTVLAFQVVIFNSTPTVVELTAAFELTVN